jgi:hypothetical protein
VERFTICLDAKKKYPAYMMRYCPDAESKDIESKQPCQECSGARPKTPEGAGFEKGTFSDKNKKKVDLEGVPA